MLSVIDELYSCLHSYHWILLIIIPDEDRVDIQDSLDKPLDDYHNLLDMLQR
jgi:hypothetical protein